jgi:hypothetical protein
VVRESATVAQLAFRAVVGPDEPGGHGSGRKGQTGQGGLNCRQDMIMSGVEVFVAHGFNLPPSIGTTTLASPLWQPSYGAIGFETQPNRYMTLNIPVLAGGFIDGSVVRSSPEGDLPFQESR